MHLLTPSLKLNDGFQCVRTKYILLHLDLLVYQKLVTELCAGDTIQGDHNSKSHRRWRGKASILPWRTENTCGAKCTQTPTTG